MNTYIKTLIIVIIGLILIIALAAGIIGRQMGMMKEMQRVVPAQNNSAAVMNPIVTNQTPQVASVVPQMVTIAPTPAPAPVSTTLVKAPAPGRWDATAVRNLSTTQIVADMPMLITFESKPGMMFEGEMTLKIYDNAGRVVTSVIAKPDAGEDYMSGNYVKTTATVRVPANLRGTRGVMRMINNNASGESSRDYYWGTEITFV